MFSRFMTVKFYVKRISLSFLEIEKPGRFREDYT
jgi:hypothetical protein